MYKRTIRYPNGSEVDEILETAELGGGDHIPEQLRPAMDKLLMNIMATQSGTLVEPADNNVRTDDDHSDKDLDGVDDDLFDYGEVLPNGDIAVNFDFERSPNV